MTNRRRPEIIDGAMGQLRFIRALTQSRTMTFSSPPLKLCTLYPYTIPDAPVLSNFTCHILSEVTLEVLRKYWRIYRLKDWLFPGTKEDSQTGPQVSRLLKRMRVHGLIRKVGKTYKYYLTPLGRRVLLTALKLRELVVIPSLAGILAA